MKETVLCTPMKSSTGCEGGFVLVISLLALLALTAVGILAISTSTTEVMVAGNTRLMEIGLANADSAIELTEPILRDPEKLDYTDVPESQLLLKKRELKTERNCLVQMDPDIENFLVNTGDGTESRVDVDFVNAGEPGPGFALEEGGPPIVKKNYVINATSTGALGSEITVGAVYYIVGQCD